MRFEIMKHRFPERLQQASGSPQRLYACANTEDTFERIMSRRRVAIVGSRMMSPYGLEVTERLARELAAHGVVIISGLAIGVDGIAHQAVVKAGGIGLAVLPTSIQNIHPTSHINLAKHLIDNGGMLVTEYAEDAPVFKTNFVARNRIVTGLAEALLITEAAENSGTLHTATFAHDQGVDVLAVPGNITSPTSVGTNHLLQTGATPVTCTKDVLRHLGIRSKRALSRRVRGANATEQQLLDLLEQGTSDGSQLLAASGLSVEVFNHHLTMLEITAKIHPLGANHWALR